MYVLKIYVWCLLWNSKVYLDMFRVEEDFWYFRSIVTVCSAVRVKIMTYILACDYLLCMQYNVQIRFEQSLYL